MIVRPFEEAALKTWSKANELWISQQDFEARYRHRHIGGGAEQEVYLKEDGINVLKVNQGRFHVTWLDYFNRLLFHAFFFPSTRYLVTGFTEVAENFAVITKQPFAILNVGARRGKVENFLNEQGFTRMKNDDYYSRSASVKLEDLHDENVFLDDDGHLLFIDPVIYFETLDLKLGGAHIFRFPFSNP